MKNKNYISLDCKNFFAIEKRLKLVILYPILKTVVLILLQSIQLDFLLQKTLSGESISAFETCIHAGISVKTQNRKW